MDTIKPESAALQSILDYWAGLRRPDCLPSRAEIDPVDLGPLLPHVALLDVIDDGRDVRYRLVGTHSVKSAGFDFTGWTASSFFSTMTDDGRLEEYTQAIADGKPRYSHYRMTERDRNHFFYERLILPLAADGRTVDMLLCGFHFHLVSTQQPA